MVEEGKRGTGGNGCRSQLLVIFDDREGFLDGLGDLSVHSPSSPFIRVLLCVMSAVLLIVDVVEKAIVGRAHGDGWTTVSSR